MNKEEKSKVQVLVATMNQEDHSILEKMNIDSDVIVCNQCNQDKVEKFKYNGYDVAFYSFAERGVGLNRNNALMRATGDICLFADDDMVYVDDYVTKVTEAFAKYSDADVIIFNLIEKIPTRYIIKKEHKVGWHNYLRYGTARVAVRLSSIKYNGIYFNQCFGGGTEHCHGEDNLFLTSCLRNKLKIYAVPMYIAELTDERESTWNKGYDDKYFSDQGELYRAISKNWWKILCLQDAVRHSKMYGVGAVECYRKMTW